LFRKKPHQNICSAAFSAIIRFSLFFTHPEMQEKFWEKIHPEFLFNCWLSENFQDQSRLSKTIVGAIEGYLKAGASFVTWVQNNYVHVFIAASKQFKFNFSHEGRT
jgi:hypothetical protein